MDGMESVVSLEWSLERSLERSLELESLIKPNDIAFREMPTRTSRQRLLLLGAVAVNVF